MKKLSMTLPVLFLTLCCVTGLTAQDSKAQKKALKQQQIAALITSRHFSFVPQTVMPSTGRSRVVTTEYELKMSRDTLVSYLPYYGRGYMASIGTTDNPLDFRTSDFVYKVSDAKKGGWNIELTPKKAGDAYRLMLSISSDGYASLEVISNNHDPISFNGYIN
jgi:Domain of unknown function (DUF4251)